jgi:hypothetical protein
MSSKYIGYFGGCKVLSHVATSATLAIRLADLNKVVGRLIENYQGEMILDPRLDIHRLISLARTARESRPILIDGDIQAGIVKPAVKVLNPANSLLG